jgi:hypothetical protein
MGGMNLLSQARQAGLTVRAEGDRLIVSGPATLEALAEQLLAEKPAVMKALADETSANGPAFVQPINATEPFGTLADADADEAEGRYSYPLAETPLYFLDDSGRCCTPGEARWWTWAGAPSWFRVTVYPIPTLAAGKIISGHSPS